mmetsp:Transcript_15530/g.32100  ORF Transcript_15530/g.32100 Transcript_15530/m.32100 type:complete len:682 (-) Transcript_15530:48-2093(-)
MVKPEGGKDQESSAIGESSNAPTSVISSKKKTPRETKVGGGGSTTTATTSSPAEESTGLSPSHLHHHHSASAEEVSTPDATRQVVSAAGIDVVGSSEDDEVRATSPLHSSTTLTTAGSSSAGTSVLGAIHSHAPYVTNPNDPTTGEHQASPHLVGDFQHGENLESPGDGSPGQYSEGHMHLYDPGRSSNAPNTVSRFPVAIKLLVSNNVAGSIIGRQGQTISELQSQSMTRIKLSQSGDYFPGTHDRVCLVQGEPGNIKVALRLLFHRMNMLQEQECSQRVTSWQQLQQSKQHLGHPGAPGPSPHDQQQAPPHQPQQQQFLEQPPQPQPQDVVPTFNFVVRLLVPTSSCGMIIGKAGSNIKFLEQASGVVSVRLSPKDALSPTDANIPPQPVMAGMPSNATGGTMERAVTITGPAMENCLQCTYMVFEGMLSHPDVSRYSNMTTTYARNKGQQHQPPPSGSELMHPLLLPHHMVQHQQHPHTLVGGAGSGGPPPTGGDTGVAGMNQQQLLGHPAVGAIPNPLLPAPPQPPAALGHPHHPLEGAYESESSLMAAGAAQAKMLDPAASFPPPPQPNESPNSKRGYLVPVSPICLGPNTFQAQIAVPDSMIGSILGRAGRTLNELQALSGTRIWISQRGEYIPGTRNRIVTVRGPTAHAIWQAQMLINQQIVLPPTAGHIEDHA